MGTCCAKEADGPIGGDKNGDHKAISSRQKGKKGNVDERTKYASSAGEVEPKSERAVGAPPPPGTPSRVASQTQEASSSNGNKTTSTSKEFDVGMVPVEDLDNYDDNDERAEQLQALKQRSATQATQAATAAAAQVVATTTSTTPVTSQGSPSQGTSVTRRHLNTSGAEDIKALPTVLAISTTIQSHVSEGASSFNTPAVLAATTGPLGAPPAGAYGGVGFQSNDKSSSQLLSVPGVGHQRGASQDQVSSARQSPPPQPVPATTTIVTTTAAHGKVANVLAALLPVEDADQRRKEREEMLSTNEVSKPKMIEFDVNFDDDDLIAVEDMGDDAEVVEDFVVDVDDDDEDGGSVHQQPQAGGASAQGTPSKKSPQAMSVVFDGINGVPPSKTSAAQSANPAALNNGKKIDAPSPATNITLNKKWFTDRGVVPPKSIQWKQDKRTVTIFISPADSTSGWELSADGLLLDFTSTAGDRGNIKIVLPLLHPLVKSEFELNATTSVLRFTGHKVPATPPTDDEDDEDEGNAEEVLPYWTQLIRGTRKEYTALTFISRMMDDDDDDEDEAEAYEYGKPGAVVDSAFGDTFSDPEDD